MASKTILILGGGVGGIATANSLRALLASEHRVVVVDSSAEYAFAPSLLWVMVGWRQSTQITKDLRRMLQPGVEVVVAEGRELDLDGRQVKTNRGDLAYDYLVVATGASLAPDKMPGFVEAAHTPYDLDGAVRLYSALQDFEGGQVAVLVSGMPYKCPAAPYEAALLIDDYLRHRGIRDRCEVDVFTPENLPMGVAGPQMGRAVVDMLKIKGIRFNPELDPKRIAAGSKELIFTNRDPAPFDLLVGIPPHRPAQVMRKSPLVNEAGWIQVDRRTLQTSSENVYAIGDATTITLANGKALPKAGVFADGQAVVVAKRIASQIHGLEKQAEFDGRGYCWIETGDGAAGFASGEFYAEPDPIVPLPRHGRIWHWGKILFEQYWLGQGISRYISKLGLNIGGKMLSVPVSL